MKAGIEHFLFQISDPKKEFFRSERPEIVWNLGILTCTSSEYLGEKSIRLMNPKFLPFPFKRLTCYFIGAQTKPCI